MLALKYHYFWLCNTCISSHPSADLSTVLSNSSSLPLAFVIWNSLIPGPQPFLNTHGCSSPVLVPSLPLPQPFCPKDRADCGSGWRALCNWWIASLAKDRGRCLVGINEKCCSMEQVRGATQRPWSEGKDCSPVKLKNRQSQEWPEGPDWGHL